MVVLLLFLLLLFLWVCGDLLGLWGLREGSIGQRTNFLTLYSKQQCQHGGFFALLEQLLLQKRLRNLRSISVRNLHTGGHKSEHISRLQSYFTLHTDVDAPGRYYRLFSGGGG